MTLELNLSFDNPERVMVHFNGNSTEALPFTPPISPDDQKDIYGIGQYSAANGHGGYNRVRIPYYCQSHL